MIIINVTKNEATVVQTEKLTSGTRGLKCKFNFSEEWDSLEKIAVCSCGNVTKDVFVESDTIVVPWEVMEVYGKYLEIGVYGRSSDDTVIIPTVYATVGAVCKGADPSGDESSAPTPSLWDKYVKDSEKFTKEYAYSKKETDDELTKYATKKDVSTGYVSKNAFEKEMNATKTEIHNTFSGALKGSVVGKNIVSMKDVSPIEHKIDVQVTSNNIPLYPYDTDADNIAGCPYTVTDDGVIVISGVSGANANSATLVKVITLSAGDYTCETIGEESNLHLVFVRGDELDIGSILNSKFTLDEETLISLWILPTVEEGKSYSWRIKPYLSKGTEIAPEVSKAKLYRSGKNLLNTLTRTEATLQSGLNEQVNFEFDKYYIGLSPNSYYHYSSNICATGVLEDEIWKITSKSGYGVGFPVRVKPNTKYVCSGNVSANGRFGIGFYDKDGNLISYLYSINMSFTTPINCEIITVIIIGAYSEYSQLTFSNIQLELGTVATEYEPYIEPVEVNKEEVTSLYPTTTLYTDTAGVKVEATYNRDITKAYAEQQKRIETLEALLLDATTN